MTEQRCGSCKHWDPENTESRFRTCLAIIHDRHAQAHRWATDPTIGSERDSRPREIEEAKRFQDSHKAVAVDYERYRAHVETRADFGCVLWEPKA